MKSRLTHVDGDGHATMVDVVDKPSSLRIARARATVRTTDQVVSAILDDTVSKGDVLAVCRIAGIQAAKRTSELVPLAHQVALSSVDVDVDIDRSSGIATIEAEARTVAPTGVEIEAMIAASIASVTFYDMVKALDRGATITDVRVIAKSGGRSGSHAWDPDTGSLEPITAPS